MNSYETLLEKLNSIFKIWKEEIKADILQLIEKVKVNNINEDIYAFVVDVRVGHYYSIIGINNVKSWDYFLTQNNCSPGKINGIYGRKYGVDDFRIRWEGGDKLSAISSEVGDIISEIYDEFEMNEEISDAEKKKIGKLYKNSSEQVMELYVECIKEMMPQIRTLNITDNFVAYAVSLWDLSEEKNMKYALETVPKELAEQIFTSANTIKTSTLKNDDMEGRLEAIRKYHLGSDKDAIISDELLEEYMTDLINNRQTNSKLIVEEILSCINETDEKHGESHYISLFEKQGAYLQFLGHYFYGFYSLKNIREYEEPKGLDELDSTLLQEIQKTFYAICKDGYKKVEGNKSMSIVPQYLARLLHQYKKEVYPTPQECMTTFYLENYKEYLKGIL